MARRRCDGQAVVGPGEMINADFGVAVPGEQPARRIEKAQAVFRFRNGVGRDHLLAAGHPGHMGVAVKGDAVGRQREQLLHRIGNPLRCLMRQSVKDIGIQTVHTPVADHVRDGFCQLIALVATDRALDFGVKVLNADGSTVHARCGKGIQPGGIHLIRVNLDRKLATCRKRGHVKDRLGQIADQVGRNHRGRAAAPVQARQGHAGGKVLLEQGNFLLQGLDIGDDRIGAFCPLCAAGAEPAQPAAEGNMQIKRYGRPCGDRVDPP